jgi:hypothetical protein
MKLIVLVIISFSWLFADYTKVGDVIKDNITGLEWQHDSNIKQSGPKRNWKSALAYCRDLSLGSKDDWRLPNINELSSISDYARIDPNVNPIFNDTANSLYWSSTTLSGQINYAWHVDSTDGYVYVNPKGVQVHVRCVRGGSRE